ncbi:MAG: hypothetical protein ACO1NW_00495 [Chitinophagaceae bacterium]
MNKRIIQLCYRKVIDATSVRPWDKLVFEASYAEFRMQVQLFDPEKKYRRFADVLRHLKGAEQLHFLVSSAVMGYMIQLNDVVPDVVNALGKHFLHFKHFRFEIINSDVQDSTKHQVAINFYTESLIWHDTIESQLVVSREPTAEDGTFMIEQFSLQPFLAIHSLKYSTFQYGNGCKNISL